MPFSLSTTTAASRWVPQPGFNSIVGTDADAKCAELAYRTPDCVYIFALIAAYAELVLRVVESFDGQDAFSWSHLDKVTAIPTLFP